MKYADALAAAVAWQGSEAAKDRPVGEGPVVFLGAASLLVAWKHATGQTDPIDTEPAPGPRLDIVSSGGRVGRAARAFAEIYAEMIRGQTLHPVWPEDPIHQAAIVAEESGELIRATLHLRYESGDRVSTAAEVRKEAIQTGAMALRLVMEGDR